MFCTNCGNQIEEPAKFCPVCGTALEQAASGQAAYTTPVQPAGYAPAQQPPPYAPPQHSAYAGAASQPVQPNKQYKKRSLSTFALIGIILGGVAVLALLVFLGLNLFGKGAKTGGAKPDIKAAGGVWSGVLRFDEYFPEDGTVSALVYASDEGILPCTLNVEKGGENAELVVNDVIIPLDVEETEHALRFKGSMADETITLDANIGADGLVSLSGEGAVTVGDEEIPFSLQLAQQSDEAPELSGGGGTLPKPPAMTAPANTAEEDPPAAPAETADTDPAEPENIPQSEAEPLPLAEVLPGTWVTNPDQDFCVSIFAFDSTGLMCHGLASSEGETTLERWDDEGAWTTDGMTWCSWTLEGDTVSMSGSDSTDVVRIAAKNEEWIVVYFEGSDEGYEFHRMGEAPGLDDYMTGTWVPDRADENGYHAILTLAGDGSVVLTGAEGVSGEENPVDWGNESSWNILGTKEGTWRMESGGNVVIRLENRDSTYSISIQGPDSVVLSYGSNWQAAYTRVY